MKIILHLYDRKDVDKVKALDLMWLEPMGTLHPRQHGNNLLCQSSERKCKNIKHLIELGICGDHSAGSQCHTDNFFLTLVNISEHRQPKQQA